MLSLIAIKGYIAEKYSGRSYTLKQSFNTLLRNDSAPTTFTLAVNEENVHFPRITASAFITVFKSSEIALPNVLQYIFYVNSPEAI